MQAGLMDGWLDGLGIGDEISCSLCEGGLAGVCVLGGGRINLVFLTSVCIILAL